MGADLEPVEHDLVDGELVDDDAAVEDAIAWAEAVLLGLEWVADVLERRGALQLAAAIRANLRGDGA